MDQDLEEKRFSEEVLAKGRIIHKESHSFYTDDEYCEKKSVETFLDCLMYKTFLTEIIVAYKSKLYTCSRYKRGIDGGGSFMCYRHHYFP